MKPLKGFVELDSSKRRQFRGKTLREGTNQTAEICTQYHHTGLEAHVVYLRRLTSTCFQSWMGGEQKAGKEFFPSMHFEIFLIKNTAVKISGFYSNSN